MKTYRLGFLLMGQLCEVEFRTSADPHHGYGGASATELGAAYLTAIEGAEFAYMSLKDDE